MDIIQGMPDDVGKSSLSRIDGAAQKSRGIQRDTPARTAENDQVDTSTLSQLMARSARALESAMKPRSDVVARFKGSSDAVDLSDRVVSTILRRMSGE